MTLKSRQKRPRVAVIGISCRLPGDVSTPEEFWTMLSQGRSGWCEIPKDRFTKDAYFHPNPQKKGCFNASGGYFMNRDLAQFDSSFFNITQQEAKAMDPQQRQLLECTYEALENAGLPKESIAGRNVGVFVGGISSDYRVGTSSDLHNTPMFDITGNHQSILAGRISHFFDLRGPSYTIDTACSSSLCALHQAVQSLRAGESELAIVAGCHLHFQPDDWVSMSMSGLFSEHSKTYSFDHRATSGFARGEGVGCIVLKPLDQAVANSDKIRSVIVNTGVNQDGKTLGIATPNGNAQQRLIREVYAQVSANPDDVGFVEAHGTGTKVGDPIEAKAIYTALGQDREGQQPLCVGSVKTNVGHLENASGIIAVIKAILMLEKGFIVPNVDFEKANPNIPLDKWNLEIPSTLRPWPRHKRYISVNNFGFSGTNAHCILERSPAMLGKDTPNMTESSQRHMLLVLSGHNETSAKSLVQNLRLYAHKRAEDVPGHSLQDLAYTLCQRRSHMPWRIALTASSFNDLQMALNDHLLTKPSRTLNLPRLVFVFTGQGAQWYAMGKELMVSHPVYAETMRIADKHLRRLGADFSLIDELNKDEEHTQVARAHVSQPACTAVQVALTRLLSSWGIRPLAVVGHSSGEIAAAYATGAISLESALAVAYHRGQAATMMEAQHPDLRGSMLGVGANAADVRAIIEYLGLCRGASIACENSPESSTASGNEDSIARLSAELEKRGIFHRKLHVNLAYHSPHMELIADDYSHALRNVTATSQREVVFYSSLHGKRLDDTCLLSAGYWTSNLTKPVLFSQALRDACVEIGPTEVIELGPHSALEGPIRQIIKSIDKGAAQIAYVPSLVRYHDATASALKLAGCLYRTGQHLDFGAINDTQMDHGCLSVLSDLPVYPWSGENHWFESRSSHQRRIKPFGRHDLLGLITEFSSDMEHTWRNVISTDDLPWLKDHKMQSLTTFPLAGFLCMVTEAVTQLASLRGVKFDEYSFREIYASRPLILEDDTEYETLLSVRTHAEGTKSYSRKWDEFTISSWTSGRGWVEHCRGLAAVQNQPLSNIPQTLSQNDSTSRRNKARLCCETCVPLDTFYGHLNGKGAMYGPLFRLQDKDSLRGSDTHATSTIHVPDTAESMPFNYETHSILPTVFVDLFIHLTFAILGAGRGGMKTLYMPSAIKQLDIKQGMPDSAGQQLEVVVEGHPNHANLAPVNFVIDAWQSPESTAPVFQMRGLKMSPIRDVCDQGPLFKALYHKLQWEALDVSRLAKSSQLERIGWADTSTVNGATTPNGVAAGADVNGQSGFSSGLFRSPVVIVTDRDRNDLFVGSLMELLEAVEGVTPSIRPLHDLLASDMICIILCELDGPVLSAMASQQFTEMQNLILKSTALLWVSIGSYKYATDPSTNMVQGLLRSVRSESNKSAATLELDPESALDMVSRAKLVVQALKASLLSEQADEPGDFEFAEESGGLVVPRIVTATDMNNVVCRQSCFLAGQQYHQPFYQDGRRLKIAVRTYGALDSLYFEDDIPQPLGDDVVEIKVAATGVNFKDVMIAMGQIPSPYLGIECSGTVSRIGCNVESLSVGDRVCAMTLGAYGTFAHCRATSAVAIPSGVRMEVAATLPVIFCTAYYGMVVLANLCPGERILIHAAAGGVGQAAIQLAQMIGAEVYATVGSVEKKKFIMGKYNIPDDRIFYSRSAEFGPAIRFATAGEGVDVVINSLAGDLLRESWECLAPFGRFIEIGKRDITSNTRLEMAKFDNNVTFSSVDLTILAEKRPAVMSRVLKSVMDLLRKGSIRPIGPITTFGISEVETVLRLMQGGKNSGKVVIVPRVGEQVLATHFRPALKRLRDDATYVIIGGTGGLGRSMARWMVREGAIHIILLSRNGREAPEIKSLMQECRRLGALIEVRRCDVSDRASVSSVLDEFAASWPPVRGVIHAAMVLRDVLFEGMSFDDFDQVIRAKVSGTWNVHNALINHQLDFFVTLSSIVGMIGSRGQAAYAAANTFLDAFVRYRIRLGMPASSLNLAAVDDAGYLSENATRKGTVLQNVSGRSMSEVEVLALLEAAIGGEVRQFCDNQCIIGLDFSTSGSLPYFAGDAKFIYLRDAFLESSSKMLAESSSAPSAQTVPLQQKIRQASGADEVLNIVSQSLQDKICTILMLQPDDMDVTSSVVSYGLDSLNAIELRNWITKEFLAPLQVLEILTSGTLLSLSAIIVKKSKIEVPLLK